jgi:hypothetical protein
VIHEAPTGAIVEAFLAYQNTLSPDEQARFLWSGAGSDYRVDRGQATEMQPDGSIRTRSKKHREEERVTFVVEVANSLGLKETRDKIGKWILLHNVHCALLVNIEWVESLPVAASFELWRIRRTTIHVLSEYTADIKDTSIHNFPSDNKNDAPLMLRQPHLDKDHLLVAIREESAGPYDLVRVPDDQFSTASKLT